MTPFHSASAHSFQSPKFAQRGIFEKVMVNVLNWAQLLTPLQKTLHGLKLEIGSWIYRFKSRKVQKKKAFSLKNIQASE